MKSLLSFPVLLSCLLCGLFAVAQTSRPAPQHNSGNSPSQMAMEIRKGERLFRTHCGRCHQPPQELSPRAARAVVRQMRVRAMLSDEDERLLLQFLAP
jgi:mono/diheme cytochrome c family protein